MKSELPAVDRPAWSPWWWRVLRTVLVLCIFAFTFTSLLKISNRTLRARGSEAGFGFGVVHGMCMPAAILHLLAGQDVPIYAEENTGRTYKLGYTLGVNSAGLIFFGSFYWRFHRMKQRFRERSSSGQ